MGNGQELVQPLPGQGGADARADTMAGEEERAQWELTESLARIRGITGREYRDAAAQGLEGRFGDRIARGTTRGTTQDDEHTRRGHELAASARSEQQLVQLIRRERSSHGTLGDREMRLVIEAAVRSYATRSGITDPDWAWLMSEGLFQEFVEREEADTLTERRSAVGMRAREIEREFEGAGGIARVLDLADRTGFDPAFVAAFLLEYDAARPRPRFPGTIDPKDLPFRRGLISVATAPLYPVAKAIVVTLDAIEEFLDAVKEFVSLLKDLVPGTGLVEALIGRDLITGRRLEPWERGLGAVLDLIPLAGKAVRAGVKGARGVARAGRVAASAGARALTTAARETAASWGQGLARAGLAEADALILIRRLDQIPQADANALLTRIRTASRSGGRTVRLTGADAALVGRLDDAVRHLPARSAARRPTPRPGRSSATKGVQRKPRTPRSTKKTGTLTPVPIKTAKAALEVALSRPPVQAATLGRIGAAAKRRTLRDALAKKLRADPNHPLSFLLENGKLRPSTARGVKREQWLEMPEIVEAGHVASALSLTGAKVGTDRFMVMSAHHNRLFSSTIEHPSKGAWMEVPHAIDIGGVPVHAESAVDWVAKGLLPAEVLSAARPVLY